MAPSLLIILAIGLGLGTLLGWLASRPAHARLQIALERDRAAHGERLRAYQDAEATFREAFQSLSAEALDTNNRRFLDLAETVAGGTERDGDDIDARKTAIEGRLAPLQKTLEQVDREIKDSERRRVESARS